MMSSTRMLRKVQRARSPASTTVSSVPARQIRLPPDAGIEESMNSPRDFLAFARFGNLGILVLSLGLLGILIHRKPARRAVSGGIALLGITLISEGGALWHGESLSTDGSIVICLLGAAAAVTVVRPLLKRNGRESESPAQSSGDVR